MLEIKNYLQEINCPVCSGSDSKKLFSIQHSKSIVLDLLQLTESSTTLYIVACKLCSHRYMTPVIKQELMNSYYSILNSEFYHSKKKGREGNYNYKEYLQYGKQIKRLKTSGQVLEIGCGNGYLLKTLEKLGYECYGIDPSPMAYDYAKNKLGLKVENSFLGESSYRNQKFDVIILIDVVEHIINMQKFMEEITSVMNEGAIIFIGTGNANSLNAKIAGPDWSYFLSWEHVSFFTKNSINYLLQKNNFTDIQITKTSLQHKPLQNFIEFFIKNLAKKVINLFLKTKYYHGITYDHFIVTATYKKQVIS